MTRNSYKETNAVAKFGKAFFHSTLYVAMYVNSLICLEFSVVGCGIISLSVEMGADHSLQILLYSSIDGI